MGYLPPSVSSGLGFPNADPPSPATSESVSQSDALDILTALHKALSEGTRPPSSILHAVTEFARILTGASGVALAVRMKGMVVCRARSGEIAPELGSPLNADSGISGECLRKAIVLVCDDAESDPRVDPGACRALTIRSILAVPLHGPSGTVGILEAFSSRPYAFGDGDVRSLEGLAEVAEAAYERECRAQEATRSALASAIIHSSLPTKQTPTTPPASPRPTPPAVMNHPIMQAALATKEKNTAPKPSASLPLPPRLHRYRIFGIALGALLITSAVAWFAWRDSPAELAASEPPVQPVKVSQPAAPKAPAETTALKPKPGIVNGQYERLGPPGVVRNAAKIEKLDDDTADVVRRLPAPKDASAATAVKPAESGETPTEPPPAVGIAVADAAPPKLGAAAAVPPVLATRPFKGVTEATLIHKVNPAYPQQARSLRLAGTVTLETTIAQNGTVREVKVVSGPPLLVAAATEAVRQWRYSPPLLDGMPIEMQRRVTIVFKLP